MTTIQIDNFDELIEAYESGQIDTEEFFLCLEHSKTPLLYFEPPDPITKEYKANVLIEIRKYVEALKNGYEAPLFITGDANYGINVYNN